LPAASKSVTGKESRPDEIAAFSALGSIIHLWPKEMGRRRQPRAAG
jgi:hypothetical protein